MPAKSKVCAHHLLLHLIMRVGGITCLAPSPRRPSTAATGHQGSDGTLALLEATSPFSGTVSHFHCDHHRSHHDPVPHFSPSSLLARPPYNPMPIGRHSSNLTSCGRPPPTMVQRPTCTGVRVRSVADCNVIFHAVSLGILPLVSRRLSIEERRAIHSGCVFVWEERTPTIEAAGVRVP